MGFARFMISDTNTQHHFDWRTKSECWKTRLHLYLFQNTQKLVVMEMYASLKCSWDAIGPLCCEICSLHLAICCVWRVNHHGTAGRWFGGSWRSWPRGNKPHEIFLTYVQVSHHERRISQIEQLNQMPLYPTEKIIWDENIVPTEYYSGEGGRLCIRVHCASL